MVSDPAIQDPPDETPSVEDMARELVEMRERNEKLETELSEARRSGDVDTIATVSAEMENIRDQVGALSTLLISGGEENPLFSPEAKQKLAEAQQRSEQARQLRQVAEHYQARIGDMLEDGDMNWDTDPALETARAAWAKGQFPDAERLVTRAVMKKARETTSAPAEDEAERTKKAVAEALTEAGVFKSDTGESGAPHSTKPANRAEAAALLAEGKITLAEYGTYR